MGRKGGHRVSPKVISLDEMYGMEPALSTANSRLSCSPDLEDVAPVSPDMSGWDEHDNEYNGKDSAQRKGSGTFGQRDCGIWSNEIVAGMPAQLSAPSRVLLVVFAAVVLIGVLTSFKSRPHHHDAIPTTSSSNQAPQDFLSSATSPSGGDSTTTTDVNLQAPMEISAEGDVVPLPTTRERQAAEVSHMTLAHRVGKQKQAVNLMAPDVVENTLTKPHLKTPVR